MLTCGILNLLIAGTVSLSIGRILGLFITGAMSLPVGRMGKGIMSLFKGFVQGGEEFGGGWPGLSALSSRRF
ncbi:hypothetical protein CEB3_c43700 [Peptococcaceae bacterium CEB3]|nr:hypothetical protein CEB3_c43700 [Peptococcaceae bacterium CEB3]